MAVYSGEREARACGSGFVVDTDRVLTCAHVVQLAHARPGDLWVAFPKDEDLAVRRLRVASVELPDSHLQPGQDVAILVLAEQVPPEIVAPLRCPQATAMVGDVWWSFGFPNGDMLGNSSTGTVGEALGYGWIRLDTDSRYPVTAGYSGAALWSPAYAAVVGMIGQANSKGDARAISLRQVDRCMPKQNLRALATWSVEAAGEAALAAWGWVLEQDPEAIRHWRPRARGVTIDAERGFRFRGRTAALTEILAWSGRSGERRTMVVTGSPGAGKSAVLGRIVTTSDIGIAASLPVDDSAIRAPLGSVVCAVHVKGKSALEVASEIARAASASLPDQLSDLPLEVRAALAERATGRSSLIVIDALDEASTPEEAESIIREIILPLAETCADLGVRVLVGCRARDDGGDLLATFGSAAKILNLDDPEFFEEADLVSYVLATLQLAGDERPSSPYANVCIAGQVAQRIASLADRNFLIAGIVARTHGLYDQYPVDPTEVSFTPPPLKQFFITSCVSCPR